MYRNCLYMFLFPSFCFSLSLSLFMLYCLFGLHCPIRLYLLIITCSEVVVCIISFVDAVSLLFCSFTYVKENELNNFNAVSEALFCLCRGTNIYNSFGGASEFQDTYHGFLYFLTFLFFSVDSLYCWCERNTGRHFIGFY